MNSSDDDGLIFDAVDQIKIETGCEKVTENGESDEESSRLKCVKCSLTFGSLDEQIGHLILHAENPSVVLGRLEPSEGGGGGKRRAVDDSQPKEEEHSPIKIKFRKMSVEGSPAFQVVPRKESIKDDESTEDSGVMSMAPPSPPPGPNPPSPLPSSVCLENGAVSPVSDISTATTVCQEPPPSQTSSYQDNKLFELPELDDEDDSRGERSDNTDSPGGFTDAPQPQHQVQQVQLQQHQVQQQQQQQQSACSITVRPPAELMAPPQISHQEPFSALQGLVSDIQTNDGLKVSSPADLGLLGDSRGREFPRNPPNLPTNLDLLGAHVYKSHPQGPPRLRGVSVFSPQMSMMPTGYGSDGEMTLGRRLSEGRYDAPYGAPQLGPGVVLTPSALSPVIPNLPPGVQVSKRPAPPSSPNQNLKQRRSEESGSNAGGIRLPDSITLVRPGVSITAAGSGSPQHRVSSSSSEASSVADMLATRGITVVPSSGRNGTPALSVTKTSQPAVTSLNSAVSITPANPQRQGAHFAMPGRRGSVAGGMRLPTVDLTQDAVVPSPRGSQAGGVHRGPRAASRARVTCQVCDKIFASPDALQMHMQSHRQGGAPPQAQQPVRPAGLAKLRFECNLCTAQYPTQQGLATHKQKYHQGDDSGEELAIPVVDLRQAGVVNRLASLGIRHAIPLGQLHNQSGGVFCLPIIPMDSARNPAVCNIGGIGASNLLPLGPLKSIR